MRDGFKKLMDVLPPNTQKTKTVTLDRGECSQIPERSVFQSCRTESDFFVSAVHHITGLEGESIWKASSGESTDCLRPLSLATLAVNRDLQRSVNRLLEENEHLRKSVL